MILPSEPLAAFAPISRMISGWKTTAVIAAMTVERASTAKAGIFLAIITAVRMGVIRSQGERLNLDPRISVYFPMVSASAPEWESPMIRNISKVMVIDGTVVKSM